MRCSAIKPENMTTRKITLTFVSLIAACMFQACNGKHDKSGMDTQSGQASTPGSRSDTSHTTDNRRKEAGGVNPQPAGASGNTNANGTTTAQGMTGADSVYQKGTQKSQK